MVREDSWRRLHFRQKSVKSIFISRKSPCRAGELFELVLWPEKNVLLVGGAAIAGTAAKHTVNKDSAKTATIILFIFVFTSLLCCFPPLEVVCWCLLIASSPSKNGPLFNYSLLLIYHKTVWLTKYTRKKIQSEDGVGLEHSLPWRYHPHFPFFLELVFFKN